MNFQHQDAGAFGGLRTDREDSSALGGRGVGL